MANLILNPGFEVDLTNWSARASAAISRDTSAPLSGVGSALVTTPGVATSEGIANDLVSGFLASTLYRLSGLVQGDAGFILRLQVDEYTSGNVYITSAIKDHRLDGALQAFTYDFVSVSTAAKARAFFFTSVIAAYTFRLDDVSLDVQAAPYLGPPFAALPLIYMGNNNK